MEDKAFTSLHLKIIDRLPKTMTDSANISCYYNQVRVLKKFSMSRTKVCQVLVFSEMFGARPEVGYLDYKSITESHLAIEQKPQFHHPEIVDFNINIFP